MPGRPTGGVLKSYVQEKEDLNLGAPEESGRQETEGYMDTLKFLDEVLKYSASWSYIPGFEPSGVAISAVFTSLGIRLVT